MVLGLSEMGGSSSGVMRFFLMRYGLALLSGATCHHGLRSRGVIRLYNTDLNEAIEGYLSAWICATQTHLRGPRSEHEIYVVVRCNVQANPDVLQVRLKSPVQTRSRT